VCYEGCAREVYVCALWGGGGGKLDSIPAGAKISSSVAPWGLHARFQLPLTPWSCYDIMCVCVRVFVCVCLCVCV
jgi:hypothetical protein